MDIFNLECFANDTINYSYNLALANSNTSWTAQTQVVSLEYLPILDNNNVNQGILQTTINPISNPSNDQNFTINFVANSGQTTWFANGGVDIHERTLIIQTALFSNTGIVQHANNIYLIVKTETI